MTRPSRSLFSSTVFWAFVLAQSVAVAQVAPFNMEPETRVDDSPVLDLPPQTSIPYLKAPDDGASLLPDQPSDAAEALVNSRPATPSTGYQRFILPTSKLQMNGEMSAHSWSVVLSPTQAASSASLQITYKNAILVAPEASVLHVSVNGTALITERISSPNRPKRVVVPIPDGLLKAGGNVFKISAEQRHRTDCTIESTYDLWTDLDPAQSFLKFEDADAARLRSISDIATIGNNSEGRTPIYIIAPEFDEKSPRELLLKLAQNIAVIANMPRQFISIMAEPSKEDTAALTVYFGTSDQLSKFPELSQYTNNTSGISFINTLGNDRSSLIISGATWADVENEIDGVASIAKQIASRTPGNLLQTHNAYEPLPPLISNAEDFPFSELGFETREFSGRRFRTEIAFGLPSDFYAGAYGQFIIQLDAAYAPSALPGSSIDIYVNGQVAANVPITARGGSIMSKFPVKVDLRHARPGMNTVTIEGNFKTRADEVCAPGQTAMKEQRFVLFDTSEIVFSKFARIGRIPDLASFASFGFPYNLASANTTLALGDTQAGTLSAAATLVARLAVAAGEPISMQTVGPNFETLNHNTLFVGSIAKIPNQVLTSVGLHSVLRSPWAESTAEQDTVEFNEVLDNKQTLDTWREKISEKGWRGYMSAFVRNLQSNFDLSEQNMALLSSRDKPYTAPVGTNLLLAQSAGLSGNGAWTVVTAPNGQDLSRNVDILMDGWGELTGNISALRSTTGELRSERTGDVTFVATQPFSIGNMRLITTNWVSVNIIAFGAAFLIVVVLLGLATSGLLRVFGRQS
ncbi:cellulose biosynthesis cyclic di-GMP-binding regulatory protein BcsB [Roseibium algae]|uniref:Cyclic di-GMP-binding protein n=1 Tax=Roseibium algae TaxID=3123038 RepID=A0ABU8TI44_9HYPH